MTELQASHAKKVVDRFKEMLGEELTTSLSEQHLDELELLIESAIDAAVFDVEESIVARLNELTSDIQSDAERFDRNSAAAEAAVQEKHSGSQEGQ